MATIPTKKISELTTKTDTPTTETYVPVAEKSGETFSTKKFDLQNVYAELGNKLGKTEKAADSDKLDGNDSTYFATADDLTSHTTNTNNPHNVTAAQLGAANILAQIKTVDGVGSGLDADLLDGKDSSDFVEVNNFNIYSKDALRTSVEAASGGKVTVLYDDLDNPSYMVRIPAFNLQDIDPDLGTGLHPAFIVNGVQKSEIFIGQYQAKVINGRACSLPNVGPSTNMTYDQAVSYCTNKGTGWHLMTAHEWAAVVLWCLKNGFQPRGNTQYGRSHEAPFETGVRFDGGIPGNASGIGITNTGSGAVTWRHDNTFSGISDLVGNIWEWQHLFKLVDGRIHTPNTNNFNMPESDWPAQDAYFDFSTTKGIFLSDSTNVSTTTREFLWKNTGLKDNFDPPLILKQLCISPKKFTTEETLLEIFEYAKGYISIITSGERFVLHGGAFPGDQKTGLCNIALTLNRNGVSFGYGCRPAFISI